MKIVYPNKRTVHINLPCDGCDKKFENPVKLRKHKSKAHDFVHCDKCGKSIIRGNYRRHLRAVHVDKGIKGQSNLEYRFLFYSIKNK